MSRKYRSALHYVQEGSGPFWLERCIERSPNFGQVPGKSGKGGAFGTTRAIGLALARCVGSKLRGYEGLWVCYPSYEWIARVTMFSTDTVERAIAALEETGYIEVIRAEGRGKNLYIFNSRKIRAEAIAYEEAEQERKRLAMETSRQERERIQRLHADAITAAPDDSDDIAEFEDSSKEEYTDDGAF